MIGSRKPPLPSIVHPISSSETLEDDDVKDWPVIHGLLSGLNLVAVLVGLTFTILHSPHSFTLSSYP